MKSNSTSAKLDPETGNPNSGDPTTKHFEGKIPEIESVLGLRFESIKKKKPYKDFIEDLSSYVSSKLKMGTYLVPLIMTGADPMDEYKKIASPVRSTDISKSADDVQFEYEQEYKQFLDGKKIIRENKRVLYTLIWGQCSPSLQAVVKGTQDYIVKSSTYDSEWLLEHVKVVSSGIDNKSNIYVQMHVAILMFFNMKQYANESNDAYLRRFQSNLDVLELSGGKHLLYSSKEGSEYEDASLAARAASRDEFLAVTFIRRADYGRYGNEIDLLEKRDANSCDEYPTTLMNAFDTLNRWNIILQRKSPRSVAAPSKPSFTTVVEDEKKDESSSASTSTKEFVAGLNYDKKPIAIKKHIKCKRCNKWGHWPDKCPDRFVEGSPNQEKPVLLQVQYSFAQRSDIIPEHEFILDSASTVSVVRSKNFVSNIYKVPSSDITTLVSNGDGSSVLDTKGTLDVLPMEVYVDDSSLANILSLKEVAALEDVFVTMDTSSPGTNFMTVHTPVGSLVFEERESGLYSMDVRKLDNSNSTITPYCFASTVVENKSIFTREQVLAADRARKVQQYIGWPNIDDFKRYVNKNQLLDSHVTADDISRGEYIYGPPVPQLQGKTCRQTAIPLRQHRLVVLPFPILEHHRDFHLCADVLFVNNIPFLHTKTRGINFLSIQQLRSRSARLLTRNVLSVLSVYNARGFRLATLSADNEFDLAQVRDAIAPALLQICGANEHVGVIERSIRTLKERARCQCHALPYKKFPIIMTRALMENVVFWLNSFPGTDGVSTDLSPASIVQGRQPPSLRYKRIAFGSYAVVYTGTTNTMQSRATRAIALREHNQNGSYLFMSLDTGRVLHSSQWTELPIDDYAIARVHELATAENQPSFVDGCPTFEFNPGVPVGDLPAPAIEADPLSDSDDDDYNSDDMSAGGDDFDVVDNNIGVDHPLLLANEGARDANDGDNNNPPQNVNLPAQPATPLNMDNDEGLSYDESSANNNDSDNTQSDDENDIGSVDPDNVESSEDENEDTNPSANENDNDNTNPSVNVDENANENANNATRRVDTSSSDNTTDNDRKVRQRPNTMYNQNRPIRRKAGSGVDRLNISTFKGKKYRPQFIMMKDSNKSEERHESHLHRAVNVMFNQMSAHKGLKQFGEKAVAAMIKEFKQLDEGAFEDKPVVGKLDPKSLSLDEKLKALDAVNLIKEKRDGTIKGRTCANGSKQKVFLKEGETITSPTISLEALIATLIIDAKEKRDVAIFDVPGAYLHAEMPPDKKVILKLRGKFVDIMCQVNPEYEHTVTYENGTKVLYMKVLRAIYGCIFSALLWYELYLETLEKMGFVVNPYDRCVANKIIDGHQCTVCWYVDDNKVSHRDPKVVTKVIEEIEGHFGKMPVSRGKKHSFLGMDIEIKDNGSVALSMIEQAKEAVEMLQEDIDGFTTSPAGKCLYNTNEDVEKLEKCDAEKFHSIVAKLLYLTKRARPDIETAIAYLCTRVTNPNIEDMDKLRRVVKYLAGTVEDQRIIGGDGNLALTSWVDAAYAVHTNMRGQTGGCMSFGLGMAHAKSSKQKLNTKSSTESEIVGVSEYIPYNIWMNNFMESQGYKLESNVIKQDNQSAIRMEINGRNSCTGNSRHIDIRYFFIKDRVDKGEVSIEYCPTEIMLADFFTKPLQGSLFNRFRDVIMGYKPTSSLLELNSIKERVGSTVFELDSGGDENQHMEEINDPYLRAVKKGIGD